MSQGYDQMHRCHEAVKLDVLVRQIMERCAQSPNVGGTSLGSLTIDNAAC